VLLRHIVCLLRMKLACACGWWRNTCRYISRNWCKLINELITRAVKVIFQSDVHTYEEIVSKIREHFRSVKYF